MKITTRLKALEAENSIATVIVVVGPDESSEQALVRTGVRPGANVVFVRTGVPRNA